MMETNPHAFGVDEDTLYRIPLPSPVPDVGPFSRAPLGSLPCQAPRRDHAAFVFLRAEQLFKCTLTRFSETLGLNQPTTAFHQRSNFQRFVRGELTGARSLLRRGSYASAKALRWFPFAMAPS